jgi:hypothetical protein
MQWTTQKEGMEFSRTVSPSEISSQRFWILLVLGFTPRDWESVVEIRGFSESDRASSERKKPFGFIRGCSGIKLVSNKLESYPTGDVGLETKSNFQGQPRYVKPDRQYIIKPNQIL